MSKEVLERRVLVQLGLILVRDDDDDDRELIYNIMEVSCCKDSIAGIAQGPILGPHLYNVAYDGILQMETLDGIFLAGYADDNTTVTEATGIEESPRKLNQIRWMCIWKEEHGLHLATGKTDSHIDK